MSTTTAWFILVVAGLLEICWAVGLKYTEGFTRPIPSLLTLVAIAASMYLLARAAQVLPIGTAYGVWVGIGTIGASSLGMFLFKESTSPLRLFFIGLLLASIVGLKLTTK